MTENFDDLLTSGPPAFSFKIPGATAKGIVVDATQQQATKYKTNVPEYWADGKPKMQLVITLRDDDGEEKRLYCKPNAKAAIQDAVRKSGGSFMPGGRLAVKYTGSTEPEDDTDHGTKQFTAQYEAPAPVAAPAASAVSDDLFAS